MNYTYDALQRLTHAETVSSAWGQTYALDGFGNLTAKTVTKGSGSNWAQAYDPATNHMTGNPLITYDLNGNIIDQNLQQTYDVENRVTTETIDIGSTSHPTWYYDASGKRVVEVETLANGNKQWTLYAYDIFGKVYATLSGDSYNINVPTRNAYFGDRLIQSNGAWVVTDRLGSVRANSNSETFSYLPYGEERTPTANARIKFGTYFRDSTTYNQDYADQRYYNPWYGRFNTPDPSGRKAAHPLNPITWNRYAYVGGDPVNSNDPSGLDPCSGGELWSDVDGGWVCVIDSDQEENVSYGGTGQGPSRYDDNGNPVFETGTTPQPSKPATPTPIPDPSVLTFPATYTVPDLPSDTGSGPAAPPNTRCADGTKGAGFGWLLGASASASAGYPLAGTASAGGGTFVGGGQLTNGTFTSAGGTAGALAGSIGNYPANGTGSSNVGLGGFGGVGGGVFVTNAGNSTSLRGPFSSILGSWGIFGVEFDYGGGIWVASVTVGKSTRWGFSKLMTKTFATQCQ